MKKLPYFIPSELSLNPGRQLQACFPSAVVTHNCVQFDPFSHSRFMGQSLSSSPFGQSLCPSHTCFLLIQNSVYVSLSPPPEQANFDASHKISHLDSSSP